MTKYLLQRILKSLISVTIVVGVVMVMIYSFLNKQSIFATDPVFTKQKSNAKEIYMMQQWELFGYLDYVPFSDFLLDEQRAGNLDPADYTAVAKLGNQEDGSADNEMTAEFAAKFVEKYEKEGYETTWSEWLPVPPPQTEVNIGMVCLNAAVTMLGDVDLDEDVDVDAVLALLWYVLFPEEYPIAVDADFDHNESTDVDDVLTLLWYVLFPQEYPLT